MKIRLPRLQRKYRTYGWVLTVVAPSLQGGTMTVTYDGTITVQRTTSYPEIAHECAEYVRGKTAERYPWVADANLNILFFDFRPNAVRPRVTGLQFARPAVTGVVASSGQEAVDA